jgi:hypothetical protein
MTLGEYEQLPIEEKEHFYRCGEAANWSICGSWTTCCFTNSMSTAPTFNTAGLNGLENQSNERSSLANAGRRERTGSSR